MPTQAWVWHRVALGGCYDLMVPHSARWKFSREKTGIVGMIRGFGWFKLSMM
jgi:hypothetical protein